MERGHSEIHDEGRRADEWNVDTRRFATIAGERVTTNENERARMRTVEKLPQSLECGKPVARILTIALCAEIGILRDFRRKTPDAMDVRRSHTDCMTLARLHTVDPHSSGAYHVVSRCVRQAWLFARDAETGRDLSHRKRWVEERIHLLAAHFAIAVYAYAIMDNHVHIVVQTDPDRPLSWSAETVLRRWLAVCPRRFESDADLEQYIERQSENSSRVAELRARLGSLSWFMRLLNEPIARRANAEDSRKGRFWEGRFRCQALLDEAAVLSAMAYVDLNPVRAGIVTAPEAAKHVSIRWRCRNSRRCRKRADALRPVAGCGPERLVTEREYLKLVDTTGRLAGKKKNDDIARTMLPIVRRFGLSESAWIAQVRGTESCYWRVIGRFESFLDKAAELGQRWLKGCRFAGGLEAD